MPNGDALTYQTSRGPRKQSDEHPWNKQAVYTAKLAASREELEELANDDDEEEIVVDDGALEMGSIAKLRTESNYDDHFNDLVEMANERPRRALTKVVPRKGMRYSTKKSKPLVLDKPLKPPKRKADDDGR
jgi:hypothetical protein